MVPLDMPVTEPHIPNGAKAVQVVLLEANGSSRTALFQTEQDLILYLIATYHTEAPLAFNYVDGSPVERLAIDRIFDRVFQGIA